MKLTDENLIGKEFYNWKILKFHRKAKTYGKYYWCECLVCGKVKSVNVQSIVSGKSKSCGCLSHKLTAYNINKKYNKFYIKENVAFIEIENTTKCTMMCDKEDLDKLKDLYIRAVGEHGSLYAIATKDRRILNISRYLLGVSDPKLHVDHKNHNTLDNRKENLRICTNKQNNRNKVKPNKNNTYGYRGVSFRKDKGTWRANISYEGKTYGKTFKTKEEAYEWYVNKNIELFGEFSGYN